jgi:GINS complex subunit 1
MYGEAGVLLVREAARSKDSLPPFNEEIVRQTIDETKALWAENSAEVAEKAIISPAITYRHSAIERNKRCLLAYINHRMETIRRLRWEFGAVLPEGIRLNLAQPELQFSSKYNRILANYMASVGTDLTTDITPPKSLYIMVRVRQDYGDLETDNGEVIQLKAGLQHHLPRDLCEQLILQGVLEHIPY